MAGYEDFQIIIDTPAVNAGLGFDAYANALSQSIANSRPRFAIGIFGPWGSGKTTLMDAVRAKLDPVNTVVVEFSAWRYEREETLLVPLLDTIRESLVDWAAQQKPNDPANSLPAAAMSAASKIGKIATSILAGLSLKVGLPGALELSFEASKALEKAKVVSLPAPGGTEIEKQVAERGTATFPQSVYHSCFTELKATFHTLREKFTDVRGPVKDLRFVVFVDDLDRCLPHGALEVLEAIKLFFETDGFVFVVGLDRSIVERFIEQRYAEAQTWKLIATAGAPTVVPETRAPLVSGQEYIKKIFQVPFNLAPVQLSQLGDLIAAIELDAGLSNEQTQDLQGRVQNHLRVALADVAVNPREVKRFINSYVMQMKIKSHLEPDVVLALQTINIRSDWVGVKQALEVHRDEFLKALRAQLQDNEEGAIALLDAEFANLPQSFLEYAAPDGVGRKLLDPQEGSRIDEYLYSVESTGTSHGAVLLDVLPLLARARKDVESSTAGLMKDAAAALERAKESLRKARSTLGNLESYTAISAIALRIETLESSLIPPSGGSFDSDQELKQAVQGWLEDLNRLILRVRAVRRQDRLDTETA
jgi:hypothetical protein